MIEVQHLSKRYGSKSALNDVSFRVGEGEILGFLGPNGAGKTTTMNIITGYLSSDEGTVTVGGHEILEAPMQVKRKLGYLPEQPPLYLDMTVGEYLYFVYALKRVALPKKEHVAEICRLVKIEDVLSRKIQNLSKGYRQRVGLAQALIGGPEALILDEPTVGLDPKQIMEIRDLIRSLGKRHTIILSSHILSEVQAVCDRVIVINRGRLVADDTPRGLSDGLQESKRLLVRIGGEREKVRALLEGFPEILSVAEQPPREENAFDWLITLYGKDAGDIRPKLFYALAEHRLPLLALRNDEMSLEEIFLRLTESDDAAESVSDDVGEDAVDADTSGEVSE